MKPKSAATYMGVSVTQPGDVRKSLVKYGVRFGCMPSRAVISKRCCFEEQLPVLDGVKVERQRCMLPQDLFLEVPAQEG